MSRGHLQMLAGPLPALLASTAQVPQPQAMGPAGKQRPVGAASGFKQITR